MMHAQEAARFAAVVASMGFSDQPDVEVGLAARWHARPTTGADEGDDPSNSGGMITPAKSMRRRSSSAQRQWSPGPTGWTAIDGMRFMC